MFLAQLQLLNNMSLSHLSYPPCHLSYPPVISLISPVISTPLLYVFHSFFFYILVTLTDSSSSECASHESGTSHAIVPSASETDVEELSSPAKRMKLSTPSTPSRELLDPSVRDQTKRKESNKSERLQSLSDVPTGMSFEVEIPVVEKSSLSENRSSGELEAVSIQERSDGGSAAGYCVTEKISSLGVLFETTVYNSNVLHVCCQLSESGAATSKDSMRKTTGE